ncbi:conserved hypothetical protein [Candidatus Desulfarcum epimagneticum]|uniref:ORC1/DEAH AAA+ ATPase domain-containing protein n=2 Tax=uncultured Desulfobacteraceae bacterium TaxID=218296 RepID=A0A484HIZ9_9BACT|nr:conserved hypothetical protein [uncultured Desulfobacteraceae bacterium]
MTRFFNTAGPNNSEDHYCFPPLERFDMDEILSLIDQKKYFTLHAPRQTGKTTCILALAEHLNQQGKYKCLYCNVESAQGAREDVKRGMTAILSQIADRAEMYLRDLTVQDIWRDVLDRHGEDAALDAVISRWCVASDRPVILIIDEIDALIGDTLISVLRQLRAGYTKRPDMFPQSIILCGIRDIRDYRIHSSRTKEIITGGSAFNIKAKSFRLGDFSREEVEKLYAMHTDETGQTFDEDAMELAWEYTQGQPWLVNALGYEATFDMKKNRDRTISITAEMIRRAKENIIIRRETHIDQLVDKLKEDRVRRLIEPFLTGGKIKQNRPDDTQYLIDLGMMKRGREGLVISNPIYAEVIPRELTYTAQDNFMPLFTGLWYLNEEGRVDAEKLLSEFQQFFRENSESWIQQFDYLEAGPQLLLQAFLQRIINGGGRIEREYGLGRKRTDLLIIWPWEKGAQRIVIELKIKYGELERTISAGLEQTFEYMDKCGAETGNLIVFDRDAEKTWDEKIFQRKENYRGRMIDIWGM